MNQILLFQNLEEIAQLGLPQNVAKYFEKMLSNDTYSHDYFGFEGHFYLVKLGKNLGNIESERLRVEGSRISKSAASLKLDNVQIIYNQTQKNDAFALVEGYLLSQYKFDKYKKSSDSHNSQPEILVSHSDENELNTLKTIVSAVFKARDLVNEPSNAQTATQLAKSFEALGLEAGFTTEILGKSQIESQKMGGLMAVNKGSQEPPSFSIMNYKPENAVNKQPYILVGKGVVFDTGGLSLKPTPNSMDYMKCDMAGSAVVGAVMYGIALLKLPVWVMGLVPATDNRPGENAICPGDVITTLDGTTVEVLNTDAEGRLILCDALSFAKKYDPQMVFDFATLTGAAANALSSYGCAVMGTASESLKNELKESGDTVYERMAELPLWPEYGDEMKGEISDLKNLGKGAGGAQSAAMFLKHFTSYQWLHFDIAGTSFAHAPKGYISQGGTGFGVRMMLNYFTKKYNGK